MDKPNVAWKIFYTLNEEQVQLLCDLINCVEKTSKMPPVISRYEKGIVVDEFKKSQRQIKFDSLTKTQKRCVYYIVKHAYENMNGLHH